MNLAAKAIKKLLRTQPIGRAISKTLHLVGADQISRASSIYSGFAPKNVPLCIPLSNGTHKTVCMASALGSDYVVKSIWKHGWLGHEAPLPLVYARLAERAKVILGVGANSGLYEIIAAAVSHDSTMYAFEPFPPAIHWLNHNIRLNHFENRVQVIEQAVSDEVGTAKLFIPEKRFGDTLETSASLNETFREKHSEVVEVPVITLDLFVEKHAIKRVDILRADVESAEDSVLRGAEKILAIMKPWVLIEVLDSAKLDDLERMRRKHNYRVFWLTETGLVEQKTVCYSPKSPNQLLCPADKYDLLKQLLPELTIT